ncbi:MAG TPA: TVP38/TMEM64 family protein [Candidatus Binatia bacterium]
MARKLEFSGNANTVKSGTRKAALLKLFACFLLLVSVSLAWRLTPLREIINFETIVGWQQSIKNYPAVFLWVLGIYVMSSLILFPTTLLNVATVVTFGPIFGNLYAFVGWLCSATIGFGIGRVLGRDWVQKIARGQIDRFFDRAERHGFLTVLSTRMVPIAPFTVVNLFVGASGITFRPFFFATAVGRIPGIITLTLFGVQLEMFLRRQDLMSWAILGLTVVVIIVASVWCSKRFAFARPSKKIPKFSDKGRDYC